MKMKRIIARLLALVAMAAFLVMCGYSETGCFAGVFGAFAIIAVCAFIINRLPEDVWDRI